jgi:DNA segregation ATPase FtsK/SpoIIIE, S-DNA-T family
MSRRGRKKKFRIKFNVSKETWRSIIALTLILLAVVSLVSFFAPDYSINVRIQKVLRFLFGSASFIFPFLLGLSGILFIDSIKLKFREFRLVLGLAGFLIVLSSLIHTFISPEDALSIAKAGGGGGLVGYKIAEILRNTISIYGSIPVLLVLLLISVLFILNTSLDQLISKLNERFPGLKLVSFLNRIRGRSSTGDGALEGGEEKLMTSVEDVEAEEGFSPVENVSTKGRKRSRQEASIEIIPTMSEPQSSLEITPGEIAKSVSSGMSNPLGMDRIWQTPPVDLLVDPSNDSIDSGDTKARARVIKDKLKSFGIVVDVVDIKQGPSVTQYSLKAKEDVRIAKIANLQGDLALALASPNGTIRIEAPIPGTSYVGIEVPNNKRGLVNFKPMLSSQAMKVSKSKLSVVLGKDVGGNIHACDLGKMPHLLVAGATGSGKSVFLHNAIFSLLFRASPQEVKLILVDPKRVELTHYQGMPHLLTPVVTDMEKAPAVFRWAVAEMKRRYKLFEQAHVRNVDEYNEKSGFQSLPYIVIVVDEFTEIMMQDPAGVEKSVVRLAQLARATGLHLILALQRPTTNVITGLIKANIPARIAFNVASNMDSRVIIDQPGAEKLLGKGDMLFVPPDQPKPMRLQGAFVTTTEIKNLVDYLKNQGLEPDYKEEVLADAGGSGEGAGGSKTWGGDVDDLFDKAVELVISAGRGSASLIQTRLSVGYARAARILAQMEEKGVVGPAEGSKPRKVLITSAEVGDGEDEESGAISEGPGIDSLQ